MFQLVYNSSRSSYKLYTMSSSYGTNRVLDVYRPIQSGSNVDIWTPNDNDAQDFFIVNRGNGYYSLHLRYNTNLALTSYGTGNGGAGTGSTSTGNVFVSTYTGSNNQLWSFTKVAGSPAVTYKNKKGINNQTYYVDGFCSGSYKYWLYFITK